MIKKQKITIRKRPLKDKKKSSVFLDYAPPISHPTKSGKEMRFQFLSEWVYAKPITPFEKQHNSDVMKRCQMIKNKIENEFLKENIYNPFELERLKIQEYLQLNFIDLMKEQKKLKSGLSNKDIYQATINLLIDFNGSDVLQLKDIDKKFIQKFRKYLLDANSLRNKNQKINRTTASNYLQKFRSTLLFAFDNGLIREPLHKQVEHIEREKKLPVYLTDEEIQKLINNPCEDKVLYRATLFMILTGLRISDILLLHWDDLNQEDGSHYIELKIKKTSTQVRHPINSDALKLMGTTTDGLVFEGLDENKHRQALINWCTDSGIKKKITWHKLRHTFAVQMLKRTKDIYMVQKLMHHKDLSSTIVYAHILSDEKKKAIDGFKINLT